jgi:hypothetical protein
LLVPLVAFDVVLALFDESVLAFFAVDSDLGADASR